MPLNAAQQKIVDKVFGPGRVGEAVVDVCSGTVASPTMAMEHSGYIFVTSERVVLRLKTMGGWHTLDFQPAMIASIEQGKGLGGGRLTILAAGSATKVRQMPRDAVDRIAGSIRALIDGASTQSKERKQPQGVEALEQELHKLSRMRDSGMISESEYSSLRSRAIEAFG